MAAGPLGVCFFFLFSVLSAASSEGGKIGVNYGRVANNLPSPASMVQLLKTNNLTHVKMYDTDSTVLKSLAGSGIKVTVMLPNQLLRVTAASTSFAAWWVQSNVAAYYPLTKIQAIAVGNEVFADPTNLTSYLVPAMINVQAALVELNLDKVIKVSSPIALTALQSSYPPSAGAFRSNLAEPVMKPMLHFLHETGSYLMVNAYPFFAYEANANDISLDYALSRPNAGVLDSGSGLTYYSLLDAQIDAVAYAMSAVEYDDVRIVISETRWPSAGDATEIGANVINAATYIGNLIRRVLSGTCGTPKQPDCNMDVYLFALFNENQKPGPTSERNYGMFYPDEQKVYDVNFVLGNSNSNSTERTNGNSNSNRTKIDNGNGNSTSTSTKSDHDNRNGTKSDNGNSNNTSSGNARSSNGTGDHDTWCVADPSAGKENLQIALDFACGEGGADCTAIQPGAACYEPNTIVAHASYAFNSYYQNNGRGFWTCEFSGTAYVVHQAPKIWKVHSSINCLIN